MKSKVTLCTNFKIFYSDDGRFWGRYVKFSNFIVYFQAEADLRSAQSEFDRQAEITKLLLEGITSTHVSMGT